MRRVSQFYKLPNCSVAKIMLSVSIALVAVTALVVLAAVSTAAQSPPYLPLNVHMGEKAPDFSLPSADGTSVKLSQFAGHNVLLNFYEGYW